MAHRFASARRSTTRLPILSLGFCLMAAGLPASAQTGHQDPTPPPASGPSAFEEEVIAEVSPDSKLGETILSDSHLVWVEQKEDKKIVKLDGKQRGGAYEDVKYLQLGPKDRFSFFGKRDSKWVLFMDDKEQSPEYFDVTGISFQRNGSSFAYCACKKKKQCRLVVDGAETGAEYQDISAPQYSRDGKRLAYLGKRGKKWVAIVDGKELGPEYDVIWFSSWGFSSDSSRFFAAATLHDKWFYAVEGNAGPEFDVISRIAFSSDGKHYAYGGTNVKGGFKKQKTLGAIVLDATVGPTYEGKGMTGSWTAFVPGGDMEVMAGGVRRLISDFHGVSTPEFDREGKLVYAARREKGDVAVFVGDNAGPGFDEILSPIVFSEDSRHFAYVAKSGEDFVEVHDNQPGKTVAAGKRGATAVGWIELSDDGKRLYYETVAGGKVYKAGGTARALRTIVVDGQPGKEYDALGIADFYFHEQSRRFVYEVYGAKGNRHLVNVDGHESRLFDDLSDIFPAEGRELRFVARDGGKFLRVTYNFSVASSATPAPEAPKLGALTSEELRIINDPGLTPAEKGPASEPELAEITARGRMLFEYDEAATHATAAVMATHPTEENIGDHLCRQAQAGWECAFGRMDSEHGRFLIGYQALTTGNAQEFKVSHYSPPREDAEFFLRAAKATLQGLQDFKPTEGPYHTMVLPGPSSELYVYFVLAQTQQGVYRQGGDARYLISADGGSIVQKRQLHASIFDLRIPSQEELNAETKLNSDGKGGHFEFRSGGHTHVLSDVPEDTDVFSVLSRKPSLPELVLTGNCKGYRVDTNGKIKYFEFKRPGC